MALTALIMAVFLVPPNQWTPDSIDSVLRSGDALYTHTVNTHFEGNHTRVFSHDEIPKSVHVLDNIYSPTNLETYYGVVGIAGDNAVGGLHVMIALQQSFSFSPTVLATFNSETVAMLFSDLAYFIFDSHARDGFGNPDPDGAAVLLSFSSLDEMNLNIMQRYASYQYELTPTIINQIHSTSNHQPASNTLPTHTEHEHSSSDQTSNTLPIDIDSNKSVTADNSEAIQYVMHRNHSYNIPISFCPENTVQLDHTYIIPSHIMHKHLKHNHTYGGTYNSKRPPRRSTDWKHTTIVLPEDVTKCTNDSHIHLSDTDTLTLGADISIEEQTFDPLNLPYRNIAYEHEIRSPPNKWCVSCNRFLFPDQVHQLSRIPVNVDHAPNLSTCRSSNLCTTCFNSFSARKTPSICVAHNELYVEDPPTELTKLNKIESRLLSLIQVFLLS